MIRITPSLVPLPSLPEVCGLTSPVCFLKKLHDPVCKYLTAFALLSGLERKGIISVCGKRSILNRGQLQRRRSSQQQQAVSKSLLKDFSSDRSLLFVFVSTFLRLTQPAKSFLGLADLPKRIPCLDYGNTLSLDQIAVTVSAVLWKQAALPAHFLFLLPVVSTIPLQQLPKGGSKLTDSRMGIGSHGVAYAFISYHCKYTMNASNLSTHRPLRVEEGGEAK